MAFPIPDSLKTRLAEGKVILFVGAAMSRPQAPGWADLLGKLIDK